MADQNKLREKARKAPDAAGVYLIKDALGNIIYVGKAKSLKKRLSSYFSGDLSAKTLILISNAADIEYQLTPTEVTALFLEARLIRKYMPKYNVSLRDDKSFPMVKITNENFPCVCITRKKEPDGARYFGPYTSASLLREALKTIRRFFPYRSCKRMPDKECTYYHIGLSPAPCAGRISKESYGKTIEKIALILEGKTDGLIERLTREMESRALQRRYEQAARIRDQISALASFSPSHAELSAISELEGLKKLLRLKTIPERIEAFDISDIGGKEASGSMVSFYKGMPDKNSYRRFRIKTVNQINDYRMLCEIVQRRYSRLIGEGLPLPDLVLIDGGKAHLLSASREMKRLGLKILLFSIAKKKENIYTEHRQKPVKLKANSPALNLIHRVRDEAHRFALSYHHILRRKKIIGK